MLKKTNILLCHFSALDTALPSAVETDNVSARKLNAQIKVFNNVSYVL